MRDITEQLITKVTKQINGNPPDPFSENTKGLLANNSQGFYEFSEVNDILIHSSKNSKEETLVSLVLLSLFRIVLKQFTRIT